MAVVDKIKPALSRAAGAGGGQPVIDPQTCLAQMLDAIGMVVLPRDMTLYNGRGQHLSLTVKSRRLIRVNDAGAMDVELGADQAPEVAETFADFAAKAVALKTQLAEPARPDILSELGMPVNTLRDALVRSAHLAPQDNRGVIPDLRHLAETQTFAWALFTNGTLDASCGDVNALTAAHDTALPHILKTEQPGQGRAASWVLGTGGETPIAIALEGDRCFVAALPRSLIQHWIKACAQSQT